MLVILSIALTGVLAYSTPAYQVYPNLYIKPTPIADNYMDKTLSTLATPPFLISHQKGVNGLITQQTSQFNNVVSSIRNAEIDNFTLINPTTDQWNLLFQQSNGLELSFFDDLSPKQLDTFFSHNLNSEPTFQSIDSISRVWLYEDPKTGSINIWFISDQNEKVIQATINLPAHMISSFLAKITPTMQLDAIPTNGKNPWDKANQGVSFSRMLYLPSQTVNVNSYHYALKRIKVNAVEEWLLQDSNIEPIDLTKNESVYTDNNQILTFYKQNSYMVYVDTTGGDVSNTPISTELDLMNTKFMDKHHGWTGNYVLENWKNVSGNDLFTFRLMEQSLPVFWGTTSSSHLDTIRLQYGPSISSVARYERSLLYLAKQPLKQEPSTLAGKTDLLAELAKRNKSLNSIERIYPIYRASSSDNTEVTLTPCWLVKLTDGTFIQIGGKS